MSPKRNHSQRFVLALVFCQAVLHAAGTVDPSTLEATTNPKMMDMTITEGPDKHRGKTSLVIYELDGDNLKLCFGNPATEGDGASERRSSRRPPGPRAPVRSQLAA